ncbi:hypothetical protein [Kineococcus radiotolerans]|nr:hypothetical protein [Kineococcus radiotolerans]
MAPLVETNDVVEALELYDGDVIKHPVTGAVMTITAHMHLNPHYLDLIPGIVRFDVYSGLNVEGPLEWEGPEEQLVIGPGMRIRRLYQYTLPPGTRIK